MAAQPPHAAPDNPLAVDAMGRPRNRLQPFRGDGAAASDAGPECARVEPPDGLYHLGEVLIQADIGPGGSVRAMTYWKTTPSGRQHIATVRSRPGSR